MPNYSYSRFSEPADAPYTPRRKGEFIIEEASLCCAGDVPVFLDHPELGAIRCQIKYTYSIYAGEDEPNLRKIFWKCADNDFWGEIVADRMFHAAWELLETEAVDKRFRAWAEANSEEVLPVNINVFTAELRRARELA